MELNTNGKRMFTNQPSFIPQITQQNYQPYPTRYKTIMCRHYEQNGTCHLGQRCHFAHGTAELRNLMENPTHEPNPEPQIKFYNKLPPTTGYSNYKTIKCKYFEKDGTCRYGNTCTFAHGDEELRKVNDSMQYSMNSQSMPMYPSIYNNKPQQIPSSLKMGIDKPVDISGVMSGNMSQMQMMPNLNQTKPPLNPLGSHQSYSINQMTSSSLMSGSTEEAKHSIQNPNLVPPPHCYVTPLISNNIDQDAIMRIKEASEYITKEDRLNANRIIEQLIQEGIFQLVYVPQNQQAPLNSQGLGQTNKPMMGAFQEQDQETKFIGNVTKDNLQEKKTESVLE